MDKYFDTLKRSQLFLNMSEGEILESLNCLKVRKTNYSKNDIIYHTGDTVNRLGIVLNGNVLIIKEDIMGNRNILTSISKSGIFAESIVLANIKTIPATITAATDSEILFLEINNLIKVCKSNCSFHNTIIKNLLTIIAEKNITLNSKIEILSSKTTREKLLTYFNIEIEKNKNSKFKIPFNREALADYLNLNRSNMTRELSKMQNEGIIKFSKNNFEILI